MICGYIYLPGVLKTELLEILSKLQHMQAIFQGITCLKPGCLAPVEPANFFRGVLPVKLSVMFLHRHRAIIWYAFGVAWFNSRGVGLF